jgi:hypothetical protein
MPNNKKKSNKKKVNGSTTPAVVVPQKDAMVVLKKALRSCSSDRLFGIYDEHVVSIGSMLPILLANKGARLDGPIVTREFLMNDEVEARDAMISHLRVAMAIDRLNGWYRQIVTRKLNMFGGLKMSCVKQRGESFTYTMGFGPVLKKYFQGRNKEIVIVDENKRVRTSWNVGRLLNQQFDRLKEGGADASPLLPGNTLHDQNSGVVWFLKTPETEEEATLLKATTTLEPTRFMDWQGMIFYFFFLLENNWIM